MIGVNNQRDKKTITIGLVVADAVIVMHAVGNVEGFGIEVR